MSEAKKSRTVAELAALAGGRLVGDGGVVVERAAAIAGAGAGDVVFVEDARLLAEALASDARLAGARVTVTPDPDGWAVVAGSEPGEPVAWSERSLGELAHAGAIAVAAGGSASAWESDGRLRVQLTVPAAPSG
jgi:hypothetical protein